MKCNRARDILLEIPGSDAAVQPSAGPTADALAHLETCAECRAWYEDQCRAAAALTQLDPIPLSKEFTQRVMTSLPDQVSARAPAPQPAPSPGPLDTVRQLWADLMAALASPSGRRRLAPAVGIVALAAVLVGLVYALQADKVPVTPGTAAGAPAWALLALVAVIAVGTAVALLLRRRK